MKKKHIALLTLALLLGMIFLPGSVFCQMDCAEISHWSTTNPPVNQKHVFCGEWNQRKNRPAGENPITVGALEITQQPNSQQIYGTRWSYGDYPDREKFSSMFPDGCTREQVLKSVVYAVKHPKPCPQGSPRWTKCGLKHANR